MILSSAVLLLVGSAVFCASRAERDAGALVAETAMPQPTATPTPVQPAPTQTTGTTPTTQPSATATARAARTPEIAPTPFPEASRARQARFASSRLTIPRIGIDAVVVPVDITADAQLETSGDELIVWSGRSGGALTFIVRETASFPTAQAPLDLVFGPSDRPELVLITCDGAFDRGGGGYLERRIVFADLCDSRVRESCR